MIPEISCVKPADVRLSETPEHVNLALKSQKKTAQKTVSTTLVLYISFVQAVSFLYLSF